VLSFALCGIIIDNLTRSAASSQETASTAQSLSVLAEELNKTVAKFRIKYCKVK
jgi:methyl-accepting chemotaxis protein